jgi:hypothetical protein
MKASDHSEIRQQHVNELDAYKGSDDTSNPIEQQISA